MKKKLGQPIGVNTIMDRQGRTYHVGICKGEVASSCLLVGDHGRAQRMLPLMDQVKPVGTTHRHFYTYTGMYEGQPLTLMSIGMGVAMMDFAVREIAQVTEGDLRILRVGSSGTLQENISVGSIAVAEESLLVQTNYKNFESDDLPYSFSQKISANTILLENFMQEIESIGLQSCKGLDVTCDEFYASQGREDANFLDKNENLIDSIQKQYPDVVSLQMETFKLYDLAQRAKNRKIYAVAAAIVVAQRSSNDFLDDATKEAREIDLGRAAMNALIVR
ncbi:MAG: hypothetical protein AB8C84_10485 [Oligoflexales bacterium]